MARQIPLCKVPNRPNPGFSSLGIGPSPAEVAFRGRIRPPGRPCMGRRFYFLLFMFNGFAFDRPLCRWIKIVSIGVGLGWLTRHVRVDIWTAGDAC